MSVAVSLRDDTVAIGGDSHILARIVLPEVHLAIWQRPLSAAFAALAQQSRRHVDDLNEPFDIDVLAARLPTTMAAAGYRAPEEAAQEIAALAGMFAAIMGSPRVRLRLDVVETDACRRFHADQVTARLLATLAGAGTQWLRVAAEDRIERLETGAVAIFKGRRWAEEPAILHRSPPIAGSGTDRLLLVIDPLP